MHFTKIPNTIYSLFSIQGRLSYLLVVALSGSSPLLRSSYHKGMSNHFAKADTNVFTPFDGRPSPSEGTSTFHPLALLCSGPGPGLLGMKLEGEKFADHKLVG
jgi:hypothetical protein